MAQLYLKGVYYDTDSGGLWFLNNSGTYEEISVGGVTIYTGDGSLTGDRTIDLNTHELQIVDSSDRIFGYWSEEDKISYLQADDGTAKTFFAAYANSVGIDIRFEIGSTGGGNNIGITGNSTSGELVYTGLLHSFNGRVSALNGLSLTISEFANNAAALAGGVPSGGVYYTTVDGEQILKRAND